METKTQRDISEVVTINLFKSLFTGEDDTKETMESIEKYETSVNILKENIEIEIISRCTNLALEKIEELKNEKE